MKLYLEEKDAKNFFKNKITSIDKIFFIPECAKYIKNKDYLYQLSFYLYKKGIERVYGSFEKNNINLIEINYDCLEPLDKYRFLNYICDLILLSKQKNISVYSVNYLSFYIFKELYDFMYLKFQNFFSLKNIIKDVFNKNFTNSNMHSILSKKCDEVLLKLSKLTYSNSFFNELNDITLYQFNDKTLHKLNGLCFFGILKEKNIDPNRNECIYLDLNNNLFLTGQLENLKMVEKIDRHIILFNDELKNKIKKLSGEKIIKKIEKSMSINKNGITLQNIFYLFVMEDIIKRINKIKEEVIGNEI